MTALVKAEEHVVLCSAPMTVLRDSDGVWLDLCPHHVDESPCPDHDPENLTANLVDYSGERRKSTWAHDPSAFLFVPPDDGDFIRNLFGL